MNAEQLIALHDGWQLAEAPEGADWPELNALPDSAWLSATVPGSAHGALLAAGRIPDPFFGRNEVDVDWVGERCWAWRLGFDVDAALAPHEELVFEGFHQVLDDPVGHSVEIAFIHGFKGLLRGAAAGLDLVPSADRRNAR